MGRAYSALASAWPWKRFNEGCSASNPSMRIQKNSAAQFESLKADMAGDPGGES
jgi:hypothetical protein